jgi:predicted nucleic acid-binding protein
MTGSVVVDASFAFQLVLPGPRQASCAEQVRQWKEHGCTLFAPALWLYEMTSALCKTVRLGELAPVEGQQALTLAQRLGVHLVSPDDAQAQSAFAWTMRLNRTATYDSFYLALAEGLQCELWTADRRLRSAADLAWVRCLGEGN